MKSLKQLTEERVEVVDKIEALVKTAEKAELTKEQKEQWETLKAEVSAIDKDVKIAEEIEAFKKEKASKKIDAGNGANAVGAPQDDAAEIKEMNKIAKKYSFAKAFKNVLGRKNHDGVEKELYEESAREIKESGESLGLTGNISIPSKFMKIGKRKLLDVATEGTDSVFSEYAGLIPILNPIPKVTTLGIKVMNGLRGNPKMVRETGDAAFAWETENADVNEFTPTLDSIDLSPKRVGGYVDVSVQFLKQNIFIVEPWLRGLIERRYELTVDDAVIDGAGSGNEPTGIFNYSGVNVLSLGSGASTNNMTYPALLSMIRSVKTSKTRQGSSGWLTNANGEFALYTTPRQTSGVEGNFIMNPDSPNLIGRRFVTSENVSSAFSEGSESDLVGIIYSDNWGSAILGTWGGLDILFDPYTQALGGKIRFVCNAYMDVEIEHAAEFAICKDWDATDAPALT